MAIMPLPWHDYLWLELDHAALLMEVTADSRKVIEQECESKGLLTKYHTDLVELELMEYFFVQWDHVFVDSDAVDKNLDV